MKKTLIQGCIDTYNSCFTIDWIEDYDWNDTTKHNDNYKNGIQKIKNFSELCFVEFSKSLIAGEYILYSSVDSDLEKFERIVENEYSPDHTIKLKHQLYKEYRNLDANLHLTISRYRQLFHLVTNKTSQTYHKYLVNAVSTKGKQLTSSIFDALHAYAFDIYTMDHMLSYDSDDIQKLILIHESLAKEELVQNAEIQPIYQVLKEKSYYLIKKMGYFDGAAEYSIDYKIKQINRGSIQAEAFKDFDKFFEFFHKQEYSDDESLVFLWENNCRVQKASFAEMILLMKYYKDNTNTTERQIENLIEKFNQKYNNDYTSISSRQFDVYALHTLKNYMYNCRLSFRMKHDYNFKFLCEDMRDLEYIQSATYIKNFYPFKKAILYLLQDMRLDLKNRTCPENILTQKLDSLTSYINKLEHAIKWCEEQRFYPVQNLYEDCVRQDAQYNYTVFTASSFSRPIKYDRLRDELQEFKSEARLLKNEISLQKERSNIEHLKSEIDASKKSNIEILGIFTAVITFLFGCVNIFSNDNNATLSISQQIQHVACLGLFLLLFISCIYILTVRKETLLLNWVRFLILGLGALGYIIILGKMLLQNNYNVETGKSIPHQEENYRLINRKIKNNISFGRMGRISPTSNVGRADYFR